MRQIALLGALVALLLGVIVAPASAGFSQEIDTRGGLVWFEEFGDKAGAADQRRDGLGVTAVVAWTDTSGENHTVFVADENGSGGKPGTRKLNIREGARVALTMCYLKDSVGIWKCSETQSAMA